MKKNIRFKQSNQIDFRTHGHPILFPINFGFDDDYLYFFTLSSQIHHYTKEPSRYFTLKKSSGLKAPSIVDLKYVYKCESFNSVPMGIIPETINSQLIAKFFIYNEIEIDQDCRELLALLEKRPQY
ncbi:pyridoxamine 5'-phosphate oxidase family protein [Caldibacillus lycopersici]|uniref:Pyridoxamine 5'-phosphate oxidase family protein n=1 Tax=Perspicuibacillus lycopersici TaxID=1325689 RepID=A0AAE3LNN4_9BACI|nr:pyridoxamine 5'-phosphate oxidase family protein [Perspicuibacillus lycopersici]MCU9614066.1 pyridoxamine 5'-phosphate oxidase family protein [Perspicuibacillus lycopersici]